MSHEPLTVLLAEDDDGHARLIERNLHRAGLVNRVVPAESLLVHDEANPNPGYAYMLSQMEAPDFPVPVGVFREHRTTTYEEAVHDQIRRAREGGKAPDLAALLREGDTWEVPRKP